MFISQVGATAALCTFMGQTLHMSGGSIVHLTCAVRVVSSQQKETGILFSIQKIASRKYWLAMEVLVSGRERSHILKH